MQTCHKRCDDGAKPLKNKPKNTWHSCDRETFSLDGGHCCSWCCPAGWGKVRRGAIASLSVVGTLSPIHPRHCCCCCCCCCCCFSSCCSLLLLLLCLLLLLLLLLLRLPLLLLLSLSLLAAIHTCCLNPLGETDEFQIAEATDDRRAKTWVVTSDRCKLVGRSKPPSHLLAAAHYAFIGLAPWSSRCSS